MIRRCGASHLKLSCKSWKELFEITLRSPARAHNTFASRTQPQEWPTPKATKTPRFVTIEASQVANQQQPGPQPIEWLVSGEKQDYRSLAAA